MAKVFIDKSKLKNGDLEKIKGGNKVVREDDSQIVVVSENADELVTMYEGLSEMNEG